MTLENSNPTIMKSSRQKRLESKKRKAEAFLQIAQLNDEERIHMNPSINKKIKIDNESSSDSDIPGKDATSNSNDTLAGSDKLSKVCNSGLKSEVSQKKPLLEGEEYEALKQRLRERKKALQALPQFTLKSVGHEAEISMHESYRTPLFMKDLQHLLLYALMGTKAPVEPSRWCKINSWNKLSNIICIVFEGLSLKEFIKWKSKNQHFSREVASIFSAQLEFVSPSVYEATVAEDFSILPLSVNQKEKLKSKFGSVSLALSHGNRNQFSKKGEYFKVLRSVFPMAEHNEVKKEHQKIHEEKSANMEQVQSIENGNLIPLKLRLLLSLEQMIDENYPIPLKGYMSEKYSDYIMSSNEDGYLPIAKNSPIFSVDCEMCLTTIGRNELTRVCVVDSDLKVVYHSLVLPDNPITHYLTQFSGITKKTLEGVTKKLKDVQEDLQKLLPRNAILVGQSLNSDLHALKMMHPYVIDTSVIYNITGNRSRKTKLAVLSNMFLGQDIQKEGHKGHDPEEDARAAMKLVLLKLEKGYEFGDVLLDGTLPTLHGGTADSKGKILSTSMFTPVKDNKQRVCVVAKQTVVNTYKKYSPSTTSRDEKSVDAGNENESKVNSDKDKIVKDNATSESIVQKSFEDEITFDTASTNKEIISKACTHCFNNNLTICHVDFAQKLADIEKVETGKEAADFTEKAFKPETPCQEKESDKELRLMKKVRKTIKRLWSHTSKNGLFVTIWPGSKTENAFVGIAVNKESI